MNLDNEQKRIIIDNNKYILAVAGAGAGKTHTILGKIDYLIKNGYKKEEILCISFTNAAASSLKNRIKNELNINIEVNTFHKLALNILKDKHYEIALENSLEYITDEFFNNLKDKKYLKYNNKSYKNLLIKFIKLFKSNGYKLDYFLTFNKEIKKIRNILNYKKEKEFLVLAINIYLMYQNYLKENNMIDFDDMLVLAKEIVNNYICNYKYIIIDEFQDTSQVRFNLIKALLKKSNASLLAVGDDFQSIYRFTGCDLNLFINFNNIFKEAKVLKIEKTYRNSKELINIAGSFIMRNKNQIKKELKSDKSINKPIIIVYLKSSIKDLIESIPGNILIISRNNKDLNTIEKVIDDRISYTTVHKSKGLESDNVIVLNVIDDKLGFPNKIEDDKVLRLVIPSKNKYPFDEERRLFYVALTRTKNKVYLITKKGKESIFIKELLNNYKKNIEVINF